MMVGSQWKTAFARLAPLHEGLPGWFPKVINQVSRSLQGRDRFNLYNTSRFFASGPDPRPPDAPQLRDTFLRFVGHGLRFTGAHAQKVILNKRLIQFWSRFLIPTCETSSPDLSVFLAALRLWRFEDLTANPIIKELLPPAYRSFTKDEVTRHCLQALFSNPAKYKQFAEWQVAQLSPGGLELHAALRQGPRQARDIIFHNNDWQAVCELWHALLVHPAYETRDGEIFLQLDTFQGFKTPFQVEPKSAPPLNTPESSLESIRFLTDQLLSEHEVPLAARECKRTFPERQLDLFREHAGNLADTIRRFLGWWHEALGPPWIPRAKLPASGCLLACSTSGRYVPFIIEPYKLEPLLETSLQFGLLSRDDENRLTLSPLGRMFIDEPAPELEVQSIWARNVNRLSLRLGEGWGEGFHRFLELLATSRGHGAYRVTPASLAKSGLPVDQAIAIIGGFTRLEAKRIERLRSWVTDGAGKKAHRKTVGNR